MKRRVVHEKEANRELGGKQGGQLPEGVQGDLELVQVTPNESAALVDFDTFIREEMTRRAGLSVCP